jgi:serine/threonine-protein kinase
MDAIQKLGRYDIIRVLGKGAMGVVYEGRDPNLDRVVAIKTIRVQNLTPEAAIEYEGRFRTEARSVARLNHPNIVSVFDSGQDDGIAYLVMEFIEGEDLKQHLESGARFSVRSSIVMVHELLMALDHAHRQNVVHRDIKPANMLMEVTGRIKLTDFGVARIQEPDETNLTQVGGAVGTPKYMSPEQAKGLRGDSRSDVFSSAVVLYELLTGTVPFTGDNQFIVIHQIVSHEPAPPSSLNPEVPIAMDEVIARAMAKNPDERYATAREFALALRAVAQQMNEASGVQGADVGAELGQFLANRPAPAASAMRDGSSTGIFGPSAEAALNTTVNHEAELGAWNGVKDSTSSQDFLGFLAHFPAGIYARRAQIRVYQLGAGDTLQGSKTEPQFRPHVKDSEFDSTVGSYAPTRPLETPDQTVPLTPAVVSDPVAVVAGAAKNKRKTWPLIAMGSVTLSAIALVLFFNQGASVQRDAKPQLVPQAPASEPAVLPQEAPPPPAPASTPSATAAVVAVPVTRPASTALSTASRPVNKPKENAASTPTPTPTPAPAPAAQHAPAPARAREVVPAATGQVQRGGQGPSMPGQVCVDQVFIFKITCIAEQCKTDRYRHTPECIRFREMEAEREEQRNRQR